MEYYIGSIVAWGGTYNPPGWYSCDGSLLNCADPAYSQLFSVIGIQYGGDGITNFAVPDFRGMVPVGLGPGYASGAGWIDPGYHGKKLSTHGTATIGVCGVRWIIACVGRHPSTPL